MAQDDFDAFLKRREAISLEYINGKPEPLLEISTKSESATLFPPNGARIKGAAAINETNVKGAKAFDSGSKGRFEILQSGASGDIAFWTGIHHADVRMKGKDEPVPMQLRTTEVFRKEDGAWKLVHRHADMVEPKAP